MGRSRFCLPIHPSKMGGKEIYLMDKRDMDYLARRVEQIGRQASEALQIASEEYQNESVNCIGFEESASGTNCDVAELQSGCDITRAQIIAAEQCNYSPESCCGC